MTVRCHHRTRSISRLPLEWCFTTLLNHREALAAGSLTFAELARTSGISQRCLERLWQTLQTPSKSRLMLPLQLLWKSARPEDAAELVRYIVGWQQSLWQFSTIGHIGKRDGPAAWQLPVDPPQTRTSLKLAVPPADAQGMITLYLAAADAGDGNAGDYALWQNPRVTAPDRPDLPLRNVRAAFWLLEQHQQQLRQTAAACLAAAAEISALSNNPDATPDLPAIAARHNVPPALLTAWLGYLGISGGPVAIDGHMQQKLERIENYWRRGSPMVPPMPHSARFRRCGCAKAMSQRS